jgi:hypothetical protein
MHAMPMPIVIKQIMVGKRVFARMDMKATERNVQRIHVPIVMQMPCAKLDQDIMLVKFAFVKVGIKAMA